MANVLYCDCDTRHSAEKHGVFLFSPPYDGWFFADDKLRRPTTNAMQRGVESHSGEPYVWHCCPWCGLDLMPPRFDIVWNPNEQGDGGSDGPE